MTAADVLGDLARLQRDPEPTTRAVGAALSAAVLEALDDAELAWIHSIERLRKEMEASTELIETALPNTRGIEKPLELGDTCRRRSKQKPWGTFLLTLARTLAPEHTLELGTCLGVSSSYLAAGLRLAGRGGLITLEGASALAERSSQNLQQLQLDNVEVVPGLFSETLDAVIERMPTIGLAFIDGHHQEEPTLAYFEQIKRRLTDPAVVVFDDIRWSEGMERAWDLILQDPSVAVAVDLDSVGVCVVRPATGEAPRVHRLPTITSMQSRLAGSRPSSRPQRVVIPADGPARLNWGCGESGEPGWINSDIKNGPGIDIRADIRQGLPLDDESMDYIVSVHALPMIPIPDLVGALVELRRVLKPAATLRLVLPDLEKGIAAWQRGDRDYFLVSDGDAATTSGKFITHLLWYGYTVTLFTAEFIEELLWKAGFSEVHHCAYKQTASGAEGILDLDNREAESLFVEAVR